MIKLETIGHKLYPAIHHLITDTHSEFYDRSEQYRVFIKLYGDEVASGMDFNPNKAAARAIEVAHEYAVKKGLIVPAKKEVNFSFSVALDFLKNGEKITRKGWNGNGMWLMLIPKSHWETTRGLEMLDGLPWVGMKTVDDKFVPWLPSQTDLFANDWMIAQ